MNPNRTSKIFAALALPLLLAGRWGLATDPVDLPLPSGATIRFLPVFIGAPSNLVGDREFIMGDRRASEARSPTEPLVPTRIGGSFLREDGKGKPDWCYFLAQTEIAQAQWAEVMDGQVEGNADLPKTDVSFHEVQEFLHRYNRWLHTERRDSLPSNEGASGYIRLPTEAEWEFACRGGTSVPEEQFDWQIPYSSMAELRRYEWISGSDASVGALKPVGRSAGSNPLGFHDLLGNASEMTSTPFSLEHLSGRVGGCTVRGGDVNTLPHDVRSSMRNEFPLYRPDGKAASSPRLGFRLAIGCDIVWNLRTLGLIAEDARISQANPRVPQAVAVRSARGSSDTTAAELAKAESRIKLLETQLAQSSVNTGQMQALNAQISLLRANFENAQILIGERDRKVAEKSVRLASRFARQFVLNTQKLQIDPSSLDAVERKVFINDLQPGFRRDAEVSWEGLTGELEELSHLSVDVQKTAFHTFRNQIPAAFGPQKRALSVVEKLADEFKAGVRSDRRKIFELLREAEEADANHR